MLLSRCWETCSLCGFFSTYAVLDSASAFLFSCLIQAWISCLEAGSSCRTLLCSVPVLLLPYHHHLFMALYQGYWASIQNYQQQSDLEQKQGRFDYIQEDCQLEQWWIWKTKTLHSLHTGSFLLKINFSRRFNFLFNFCFCFLFFFCNVCIIRAVAHQSYISYFKTV